MQQKIVVAGAAVLAVALALPAAAVVFSGGGGGGGDSQCDQAHTAFDDLSDQAQAARAETDRLPEGTAKQDSQTREIQLAGSQAALLVGAPECFDPAQVARGQEYIDMIRSR